MTTISDDQTAHSAGAALPASCGAVVPDSIADIAERLMGEFGGQLDLSVISGTVLDCRDHLVGSPPELVVRLARQRLVSAWSAPGQRRPTFDLRPVCYGLSRQGFFTQTAVAVQAEPAGHTPD